MENNRLHKSPGSLLCRVTSVAQLRLTATVYMVLLLVLFVVQQAGVKGLVGQNGVVVGRDFLVFYTAGRMVNEGKGAQLYDPVAQKSIQDEILAPQRREGTSYYTNPASVAVAYASIS